jgi:hypothetical protein
MAPNDDAERRVDIPTARHFDPRGISMLTSSCTLFTSRSNSRASPLVPNASASQSQILATRRRSALPITDTELKLMAAAATMGLKRIPKVG